MIDQHTTFYKDYERRANWHSLWVEMCTLTYDFPTHKHDYYEGVIILSGSGNHIVGNKIYPLKAGDVFVIKGDMEHGFIDCNNIKLINLMYDHTTFMHVHNELRVIPGFEPLFIIEPEVRSIVDYPYVLTLLQEEMSGIITLAEFIIEYQNKNSDEYRIPIKMVFSSLIAYLAAKYQMPSNPTINILTNAVFFMHKNFSNKIKIEDIAAYTSVSPRHLTRLFSSYYKDTPISYLNKLRLEHSLILLSNSDVDIYEIALTCGFTDPTYFSRLFKQTYGVTPSKMRNNI